MFRYSTELGFSLKEYTCMRLMIFVRKNYDENGFITESYTAGYEKKHSDNIRIYKTACFDVIILRH